MTEAPRIALFADTFYEVNGAARTCREWDAFARRRNLPFLCVRWGQRAAAMRRRRGVESGLGAQPAVLPASIPTCVSTCASFRFLGAVEAHVRRFRPDFIHLTSPGDLGILGAIVAARLKTPLAASWHTNLHEFAARRVNRVCSWLPGGVRSRRGQLRRALRDGSRLLVLRAGAGAVRAQPRPAPASCARAPAAPCFPWGAASIPSSFTPRRRSRTDSDLVLAFVGPPHAGEEPAPAASSRRCVARGRHRALPIPDHRRRRRARLARAQSSQRRVHWRAHRRAAGAGLCRRGYLSLSVPNRHVRQCGAGSARCPAFRRSS